jgi:exosortase
MNSSDKSIAINDTPFAGAKLMRLQAFGFLLVCVLPFVLALDLTRGLFTLILEKETFSQIPLIPLVSAVLLYENRKAIFSEVSFGRVWGIALITLGLIFLGVARLNLWRLSSANQGSVFVFGVVLVWMGAFAVFFGARAFRAACFPLLFLLFAVPIPEPILSKVIYFLQKESAEVAEIFFRLAGIPYFRQGFVFELPTVTIRVAEECSGIRSAIALLITTVLASHFFLRTTWRRLILCAFVVPLAIFKNGLRIMALTTLSVYVNPGFLSGNLHHHGGIVFFMFALVPAALLLVWLQKGEKPNPGAAEGT